VERAQAGSGARLLPSPGQNAAIPSPDSTRLRCDRRSCRCCGSLPHLHGSRRLPPRSIQQVEHNRLHEEEVDWLGGVGKCPLRDRKHRQKGTHPVHGPSRPIFLIGIFGRIEECRHGAHEDDRLAHKDAEQGIVVHLPEHDADDGTHEAKDINLGPACLTLENCERAHDEDTGACTDHHAVERPFGVHREGRDPVEASPDNPGRLVGLGLALEDRADVRHEGRQEHETREGLKEWLHGTS
jgi:hypothetical protein